MLNVTIFEATEHEIAFFKKALADTNIAFTFSSNPLTKENVKEFANAQVVCVFIHSLITKQILEQLPHLGLIITRSTGYDHIDIKEACERSIAVCNTPIYATTAVTEYTLCLIMSLIRKMREAIRSDEIETITLQGIEIKNKILGIVGTGNIGKEVIKLARCFGMKIIAYDINPDSEYAKQQGFEYVAYDVLLATADIISFHVMLTSKTMHIFNNQSLSRVKKGVYIINTARGAVIDNNALVQGLQKGIIAGVALDVLEQEDLVFAFMCRKSSVALNDLSESSMRMLLNNIYLLNHPAVIITPHIAFNTCEAQQRQLQTTVDIVRSWQENKIINKIKC